VSAGNCYAELPLLGKPLLPSNDNVRGSYRAN
jgi:hypothetical protein